ncbi:MAG: clostripain-related cysteine peptidase [Candidatus Eremiobacteraeota bacterium]|nr:clostripain-related cysteine peptidase [Candidatus Eremiobacteraeota bacterium]
MKKRTLLWGGMLLVLALTVCLLAGPMGCGGYGGDSSGGSGNKYGWNKSTGTVGGYCYSPSATGRGDIVVAKQITNLPPGYVAKSGIKVRGTNTNAEAVSDSEGYFELQDVTVGYACTLSFYENDVLMSTLTVDNVEPDSEGVTLATSQGYEACLIPPAKKPWTYICYIAADNSLGAAQSGYPPYAENVIDQMEVVGSSTAVNVVAFLDEPSQNSKIYYVIKDPNYKVLYSPYQDLGSNVDSGDYKTFVQFVQSAMTLYPADHYVVDIWNHGSGPAYGKGKRQFIIESGSRDICFDDVTSNQITLPQLKTALASIKSSSGKNVEILVMSLCLAGGYETVYEMMGSVDYCIASPPSIWGLYTFDAASIPFQPYDTFLNRITNNYTASVKDMAIGLAQDSFNQHVSRMPPGEEVNQGTYKTYVEHCIICLDINKMSVISSLFSTFALECYNAMMNTTQPKYLGKLREISTNVPRYCLDDPEQNFYAYLNDLEAFAYLISVTSTGDLPSSLQTAASNLMTAIGYGTATNELFLYRNASSGYTPYWIQCGMLSVLIPYNGNFTIPSNYKTCDSSKDTKWGDFATGLWPQSSPSVQPSGSPSMAFSESLQSPKGQAHLAWGLLLIAALAGVVVIRDRKNLG